MTAHPIAENAGHWWLCCGKWRRLHAIPGTAVTAEQMRKSIDDVEPVQTRAACGLRRPWWMPGLITRLGRRRCVPCCRALGIPAGCGTPANEQDLKENHPA